MTSRLQIPFLYMSKTECKPFQALLFNICLFLVFFWFTLGIAAETASTEMAPLDRLLTDIQNRVSSTRTVQCTFTQERNLSVFSRPILFTGKMALSRPDMLRWENLDPIPSVLIFAGEKGMRCNDDAPPVHFELEKDPIMKMISEQIWTWVDGNYARLQSKYAITMSNEQEIILVPQTKEFADIITSVSVTFEKQSLQPETIHILETGGDSTTIRFTDYRLNQPIDAKLFTTCYP